MASKELAEKHIPLLRASLATLVDLSQKTFGSPVNVGTRSHMRFMCACFASKQIEHSQSILKLDPSIDTTLIARSMLEGLAQLLWAAKQPRVRPHRWRTFPFVTDWRLLVDQLACGAVVDSAVEKRVRKNVHRYGKSFLSKQALQAMHDGKPLPADPYTRNWYGESEKDIMLDIGGITLYESAYGPFSEWHHWRPSAFGKLLSYDPAIGRFSFTSYDPNQLAMALAIGFQCLWQTTRLFNSLCHLGVGHDLRKLYREHVAIQKLP